MAGRCYILAYLEWSSVWKYAILIVTIIYNFILNELWCVNMEDSIGNLFRFIEDVFGMRFLDLTGNFWRWLWIYEFTGWIRDGDILLSRGSVFFTKTLFLIFCVSSCKSKICWTECVVNSNFWMWFPYSKIWGFCQVMIVSLVISPLFPLHYEVKWSR